MTTIISHYYFKNKKLFKAGTVIVGMFNIAMFASWVWYNAQLATGQALSDPYFIYPALVSGMILVGFYYFFEEHNMTVFQFMVAEYVLLNTLCIILWFSYYSIYPWFYYVMLLTLPPLIHYRLIHVWKDKRFCTHIGALSIVFNILLLLLWQLSGTSFPWFIFPLLLGIILQIIFYCRWKNQRHKVNVPKWIVDENDDNEQLVVESVSKSNEASSNSD